jgi:hypothetical protein
MAKKTGEKEEERVKLCTSASVFDDDEYANVYAYNRKNAKKRKLIMRDAAKHVYVKETQVSTDECNDNRP